MAGTLLQALAATFPRRYLDRLPSGESVLRELYQRCASAKLVPTVAVDDIARLHGLFDVALEHGLGSLVHDYVLEVCSDRALTSSDPVEAFLMDGECVRRWCHKTLSSARQRLMSWLDRGIPSIASARAVHQEVGKLCMVQLIAEALVQPEQIRLQQRQQQRPAEAAESRRRHPAATLSGELSTSKDPSIGAGEENEVEEARRLVQCGRVVAWLRGQQLRQLRPTGRFSSEQEWRGTVAKRRDGASPSTLFLADLMAQLVAHGVDAPPYPPPSMERMLQALFLLGPASAQAWHCKLALFSYYLADGSFILATEVVEGLRAVFGVPVSLRVSWMVQLFLDDAQLVAGTDKNNLSLVQASNFLPGINGATVPFKMVQVFLSKGRPDIALSLLRQRTDASARADLHEALTALKVRLANGLLAEAYLEMKRHLDATPVAQRAQHADCLVGELMRWGAEVGGLHGIVRLPFGAEKEESAAVSWLERSAQSVPQAGLMLALYYLIRGRTPEALHAYALLCQPMESEGRGGQVEKLRSQLEALLLAAARVLPAPQRALVVQQGEVPALRMAGRGAGEGEEGVALAAAVRGLDAGSVAALLSSGPSLAESPLVGSIPALAGAARQGTAAGEVAEVEHAAEAGPPGAAQGGSLLLFGQASSTAAEAAAAQGGSYFGAAAAERGAPMPGTGQHQLDRLLGLAPAEAKGRRQARRSSTAVGPR